MSYNNFVPEQNWKEQFDIEISQGQAARAAGNEGRARVCARRAAAIAVREYFTSQRIDTAGLDAYRILTRALELPALPPGAYTALGHLVTRVEPGGAFPIQADLLADASWLASQLLPEQ